MKGRPILVAIGILAGLALVTFAVDLAQEPPVTTNQDATAAEVRVAGDGRAEPGAEATPAGDAPLRSARPAPAAEPDRPADEARGSLLVTVVRPGGDPAAGIPVIVNSWQPLFHVAGHGATGTGGTVGFADLPPGRGYAYTAFGGSKQFTIKAGEQASARIELEGVAVRGTVVDGSGVGVAGADIWLTTGHSDWAGGAVVATSAVDGGFELPCVPAGQSLGALAAGFAPSALVDLDDLDTKAAPVPVRLEVSQPGGAVTGTVTTRAGTPVAGADVCVGARPERMQQRTGGRGYREVWTPRLARTDAQGHYTLPAVTPGRHPFVVRAAALPYHKGEVEVRPGAATRLDIEMPAGVTVHGVVRDKDGAGIAGAVVRGYDSAISETYLQGGQFDYDSVFGFPFTSADAAGRYRLTGVAEGAVHLYATRPGRARPGTALVRAKTVLQGEDGAELEWDPVLDPGATIAGVVTYRDGSPMSTFISLTEAKSGARQTAHSGKHGRFEFVNLRTAEYTVEAQRPFDAPGGAGNFAEKGVWPDRGELRLVAPYDSPSKAVPGSVRGRVDDAARRHQDAEPIEVQLRTNRGWRTAKVDAVGDFAFERTPPDRYRLTATSGEAIIYSGAWFELGPAEQHAAGTLVTEPGGDLLLRFDRRPGTEHSDLRVFARCLKSADYRLILTGREAEFLVRNLSVGRYEVYASSDGVTAPMQAVAITAGQRAELKVVVYKAVLQKFELAFPSPPGKREFDYEIRGASGEVFARGQRRLTAKSENPYTLWARLPVGRGTIVAKTATGLGGTEEYSVADGKEGRPSVRVAMVPAK